MEMVHPSIFSSKTDGNSGQYYVIPFKIHVATLFIYLFLILRLFFSKKIKNVGVAEGHMGWPTLLTRYGLEILLLLISQILAITWLSSCTCNITQPPQHSSSSLFG